MVRPGGDDSQRAAVTSRSATGRERPVNRSLIACGRCRRLWILTAARRICAYPATSSPSVLARRGARASRAHGGGGRSRADRRLGPAAATCAILAQDGSLASPQEVRAFAAAHDLAVVQTADIATYRRELEPAIEGETSLPTPGATFLAIGYRDRYEARRAPRTRPGRTADLRRGEGPPACGLPGGRRVRLRGLRLPASAPPLTRRGRGQRPRLRSVRAESRRRSPSPPARRARPQRDARGPRPRRCRDGHQPRRSVDTQGPGRHRHTLANDRSAVEQPR
jgi:hypothetical protein